jgi:hypothetical protein
MENRKLQYQLSNGNWVDCEERSAEFLTRAENFINNHPNKAALLGEYATVQDRLNAGKSVYHGTNWYSEVRYEPIAQPIQKPEMVKCDCGCTVSRGSVMNASLGTSCPDCYDRMSY